MIQIRNVPDDLHRKLKARAAEAGVSLSDYLLRDIRRSSDRPTMREWLERIKTLTPVEGPDDAAETIRDLRGPLGSG